MVRFPRRKSASSQPDAVPCRAHGWTDQRFTRVLSRVGRIEGSITSVSVKELLVSIIDLLSPPAGIEIAIATNMPTLNTDAIALHQVFSNLIGNAIKYHNRDRGKITISAKELDKYYEFAVADDGPGIEPRTPRTNISKFSRLCKLEILLKVRVLVCQL